MAQKFEWDNSKAVGNLLKHGVSFEEGKTVFDDLYYIDFYDPDHSQEEHRTSLSACHNNSAGSLIYRTR